jgi:hypothetical protein
MASLSTQLARLDSRSWIVTEYEQEVLSLLFCFGPYLLSLWSVARYPRFFHTSSNAFFEEVFDTLLHDMDMWGNSMKLETFDIRLIAAPHV